MRVSGVGLESEPGHPDCQSEGNRPACRGRDDGARILSGRVVVIGGGFAGAYCVQALERLRKAGAADTVLIDRNNYFLFYPLLVEAGTGSLEPRHVVVPIRSFLRSSTFLMGDVAAVDLERRQVDVRMGVTGTRLAVPYDHLVVAPGSVTRIPDVPGLDRHGYRMKSLADAVALRDRAIALLEAANAEPDPARRRELLHLVVVGANFTGAEVAGEYHMFLRDAARHYPNLRPDDCRVSLIEISDRILPALDEDLAAYAQASLERRGVSVRLGTSVEQVRDNEVVLRGGETLPTRTLIWCAGIAPSPLISRLGLPVDERGYVLCERDFRVRGFDHVWSIGDTAVNPDASGRPYPATAQHAVRQGRHLARNLVRVMAGGEATPFDFEPLGSLVALGCRTGVAKILGVKLSGFPAWWMHRTVYLGKMPGLGRKARVAIDWTLDLLSPTDVVQLGVHRRDAAGASVPVESIPENPRRAADVE